MIRFILFTLFFIVLGAIVFTFVKNDSGFVHIAIGGYELITSFWLATLGVVFASLLLWFIISATIALLTKTGSVWSVLGRRQHDKAENLFSRGMLNYVEGNWAFAKDDLVKSAKHADTDHKIVATLAAVHCALEEKDFDAAQRLLDQARRTIGRDSLALKLTEARLLDSQGKVIESIASLEATLAQHNESAVVLKQLAHEYERHGAWFKLGELIPRLERFDALSANELHALKIKTFREQLDSIFTDPSLDLEKKREEVKALVKRSDSQTRENEDLVQHLVAVYNELGETKLAEKVARQALNEKWSESMLETYAKINTPSWDKQIDFIESKRYEHTGSVSVNLALARLTRKQEMTSKAEEYYQAALQLDNQQSIRFEIAEFYMAQNRREQALEVLFDVPKHKQVRGLLPASVSIA